MSNIQPDTPNENIDIHNSVSGLQPDTTEEPTLYFYHRSTCRSLSVLVDEPCDCGLFDAIEAYTASIRAEMVSKLPRALEREGKFVLTAEGTKTTYSYDYDFGYIQALADVRFVLQVGEQG